MGFSSTRPGCLSAWLVLGMITTPAGAEPPKKVDFAHDIAPLLKARCVECHANGKYKGSFSIETRAAILQKKMVVPGKSGASELVKRLTSGDPEDRMPPKGD